MTPRLSNPLLCACVALVLAGCSATSDTSSEALDSQAGFAGATALPTAGMGAGGFSGASSAGIGGGAGTSGPTGGVSGGGTTGSTLDAGTSDFADAQTAEPDAGGGASEPEIDASGSDDIFGASVPRSDSWWVAGGRIYYGASERRLFGLNWFGLEGDAGALYGPIESGRGVSDFLAQLKQLGFNALRVPLSPESIRPGIACAEWAVRGDIDTGREHLDELIAAAESAGVDLLLDVHTCARSVGYLAGSPTDPACTGYTKQAWLDDLRTLAQLAALHAPRVIGIDLFNEPHALTWTAWSALAEEGGRVVLEENPRILVFVEGVGAEGYVGSHGPFWGENLSSSDDEPLDLPASRLVLSPHIYGPSVYAQPYFADASFPANMPAIWDEHFGFVFDAAAQPVVPGEFGGRYTGSDRIWQDAFVDYLLAKNAHSFFYWSLNPSSGDTGGLLLDDWQTPNADKVALLQRLMP